jgi:hypothetical protein
MKLGRIGRSVGIVGLLLAVCTSLPGNPDQGPPVPVGEDGCPTAWNAMRERGYAPGRLMPDRGAVSVTFCELTGARLAGAEEARKLTTHVEAMVGVLNSLPTRDEMEAEIRATSAAEGQQVPDDLLLGNMCTLVGYSSELSFSVEYRNGRALVMLDRNCGIAQSGGLTRFMPSKAVDAFLGYYREQLAARRPKVTTPDCQQKILVTAVDNNVTFDEPRDDIGPNRGENSVLLPDSILEANACRYRREDDVFRLTGQKKIRDGLDGARRLFNDTVRGEMIGRADSNWMACAMPSREIADVTALDVVWMADATGGVVEIRAWRGPCTAVMASRVGARVAKAPLLLQLDEWLRPAA